jgi:hypothetical protein
LFAALEAYNGTKEEVCYAVFNSSVLKDAIVDNSSSCQSGDLDYLMDTARSQFL